MRRTEQVQGLRLMKFEEIYERTTARRLSQHEAASILGVSERTFRRWRDRFEASGAEGLYDRRLGRPSGRRLPVDTVMAVLELFDTRYWDFTARHFWEKLSFRTWLHVQLQLGSADLAGAWPDPSGAHAVGRIGASGNAALGGMMLHQDGSSHQWVDGQWWDLIVTMDDATSDIYSALFVEEEGTMSSFQALDEVIAAKGYSIRCMPIAAPITGILGRRGARWTRIIRPRSAAPSSNWV